VLSIAGHVRRDVNVPDEAESSSELSISSVSESLSRSEPSSDDDSDTDSETDENKNNSSESIANYDADDDIDDKANKRNIIKTRKRARELLSDDEDSLPPSLSELIASGTKRKRIIDLDDD
jgi:hypothetical protein